MSAMGDRFLILEETADELDALDPELAARFRVVNGLPTQARKETAAGPTPTELMEPMRPPSHHEVRMEVVDGQLRCDCTCAGWSSAFGWDEINMMVARIREHLGSDDATSGDGIAETPGAVSLPDSEKRVG